MSNFLKDLKMLMDGANSLALSNGYDPETFKQERLEYFYGDNGCCHFTHETYAARLLDPEEVHFLTIYFKMDFKPEVSDNEFEIILRSLDVGKGADKIRVSDYANPLY